MFVTQPTHQYQIYQVINKRAVWIGRRRLKRLAIQRIRKMAHYKGNVERTMQKLRNLKYTH